MRAQSGRKSSTGLFLPNPALSRDLMHPPAKENRNKSSSAALLHAIRQPHISNQEIHASYSCLLSFTSNKTGFIAFYHFPHMIFPYKNTQNRPDEAIGQES